MRGQSKIGVKSTIKAKAEVRIGAEDSEEASEGQAQYRVKVQAQLEGCGWVLPEPTLSTTEAVQGWAKAEAEGCGRG